MSPAGGNEVVSAAGGRPPALTRVAHTPQLGLAARVLSG